MKKISTKQIIAGGLATTVLTISCKKEILFIDENSAVQINENFPNGISGDLIKPLNLKYSSEDYRYLMFLNQLADDIIKKPKLAEQFRENPSSYLKANNISDIDINLDEGLLKMISALGNDDIIKSIKNNDIGGFIELLKKNDLVSLVNNSDLIRIERMIAMNPNLSSMSELEQASLVAFAVALVVGVAAFVWAVAVTHAAVANVAAAATVFTAVVTPKKDIRQNLNMGNDEYILNLWQLKNGHKNNTYLLIDQYKEQKINDLIYSIEKNYPELSKRINKEQVRNLLKLNI